MAGQYEKELVKERSDILQVIAPYVALKRAGRLWKGLCPFHNEKTPSFSVDPDRKIWHCYGQCSEGGDAIKFLQKVENLTFAEALERLAIQAGVTLTPFKKEGYGRRAGSGSASGESAASGQISERDRLYAAVECAARFYEGMLDRSTDARAYLQGRGIAHEAQKQFRLGYASEDWDALPQFLLRQGVSTQDALTAGLLASSDKGSYYDKLRGRIIFPILDVQERVIGFGGRLMEAVEGRPKYLNSAETPLFSKGRTLYGLWRARKAIAESDRAIIVEGYMDVIAAHQAGIENVVAALGTSLTEQHAQILGRFAQRVLLSFDADAAGLKAAQRAAHIFAARDIETRMMDLPEGEDPDSLIRAGRVSDFAKAVETALPVAEHHLRKIVARPSLVNSAEPERLAVFRREVMPILRSTKSVIERERYIRLSAPLHPYFSTGSAYAEEQIRQEIEGRGQSSYSSPAARPGWRERRPSNRYGGERARYETRWQPGRPGPSGPIPIEVRTAEEIILRALFGDSADLIELIVVDICPEHFHTPAYRALAQRRLAEIRKEPLANETGEEEFDLDSIATKLLLEPEVEGTAVDKKAVEDSIASLKKKAMQPKLAELRARVDMGDLAAMEELPKLQKQLRERRNP
jgi:DNA primase